MKSESPWTVQVLDKSYKGYNGWEIYAIRDARNHCIAVVGDVDRATDIHSKDNVKLMQNAPEMADLLYKLVVEPTDILRIMRENNLVIDNHEDPMQKLALTLYTKLVSLAGEAEKILSDIEEL